MGLELKAESQKFTFGENRAMRECASALGVATAYANITTWALAKKYGLWKGTGSENIIRGYVLGNVLGLASIAANVTHAVSIVPIADVAVALNATAYTLINAIGLVGYIAKKRDDNSVTANNIESSVVK